MAGKPPDDTKSRRKSYGEIYNKFGDQLDEYFSICQEYSIQPSQLSLSWLLHNPVVTAPIIGPRTVSQLEESLIAIEYEIEEDLMKKLEKIWPGPGGPAPEAYSW